MQDVSRGTSLSVDIFGRLGNMFHVEQSAAVRIDQDHVPRGTLSFAASLFCGPMMFHVKHSLSEIIGCVPRGTFPLGAHKSSSP